MDYSKKTQELIERQCRNVERKEFVLNKEKAEDLIMKTYDLFGIKRPSKVVWFVDLKSKQWDDIARSASSARSAWSAWSVWSASSASSARSARSASSAWSARSASSASSARSAWLARSASSARSAWSAWSASSAWLARSASSASSASSAWSARSARSALDYDFDWFTFSFQYKEDQTDSPINENDIKYLEYCELLMQAKEAGVGYRVEWEDTLYLVPNPIVRLNEDTPPAYHSDQLPAIAWVGGEELYYLDGVNLPKKMWKKIVSKKMSFSEIMKIEISDQRTVALKYNPQAIIKEKAKLIHKDERNNELYLVENSEINTLTNFPEMYFLKMTCPTGRVFIEGVEPNFAKAHQNATECQAYLCGLTKSEYMEMSMES